MPLPSGGAWPPEKYAPMLDQIKVWRAWWTGDTADLTRAYTKPRVFPSQYRGGAVGAMARFFWGKPPAPGEQSVKSHVPIAADIATMSADLLFASPPALKVKDLGAADGPDAKPDQVTIDRIEEYIEDGLWSVWREAAEAGAALSGVFVRAVWDRDINDKPWLSAVHADCALPEFVHDRLKAVTFFTEIERTGSIVVRYMERHEVGTIQHAIYAGTDDQLGKRVPLSDYPDFAHLTNELSATGDTVATGIPMLTAVYVPNMRPNKQWNLPIGRSDYAGIESSMDELDEVMTSWLRDIRLAKARLLVPEPFVDNLGRGLGATYNPERELVLGVMMGPDVAPQLIQPDIRWQEHRESSLFRIEQIVRGAGYSMASFAPADDAGGAITATEIKQRKERSLTTRERKIGYFTPEIASAIEMLLALDKAIFGTQVTVQKPSVEFPDAVTPDPESVAATLSALDAAGAISTPEKVKYQHSDWDEAQVDEEVARLSPSALESAATSMNLVATLGANISKAVTLGAFDEATAQEMINFVLSKAVDDNGDPLEAGPTDIVGTAERAQQDLRDQAVAVAAARPAGAVAKPPAPGGKPAAAGAGRPAKPAGS